MIVILFRSKLTSAAGVDYAQTSEALESYVKTKPGFIAVKSFTAEDGERLTIVWWKDRETLEQWRTDSRHMEAKSTGRERWYEYYKMEVAEVFRESKFERASV
jgi:heme-degrading monooxygenase HmoA